MSAQLLQSLPNQYSYSEFLALCRSLAAEDKATSNADNPVYVEYSKQHLTTMEYWEQKNLLTAEAKSLSLSPQHWYVITEGWCGDSAHILPLIHQLKDAHQGISMSIILRDEYPEAIDAYLTRGGRSIPKLVMVQGDTVTATWGPRPEACQHLHERLTEAKTPFRQLVEQISNWYIEDNGKAILAEVTNLALGKK